MVRKTLTSKKSSKSPRPAPTPGGRQAGTAYYEKLLNVKREDILKLVQNKQEAALTEQDVGDEADAASLSTERELMFELSDNERQTLDAVEAALRKIGQGLFGICESCKKKIKRLRLRAMPEARYCIQCQAQSEGR